MERALREYTRWKSEILPEDLVSELNAIADNYDEIYDRFCRDIAFGTSGLRGKMGAGTNRINSVMLRKASLGIARYLTENRTEPAVVIGYDTRLNSKEYAEAVAEVFAARGVRAYLFGGPTPVPVVSFAVRRLGINGGIMITASHNTREYNGYKVYDHFGNQIDELKAGLIEKYINEEDPFAWEPAEAENEVILLDGSIRKAYLEALKEETLWWDEPEKCRKALEELQVCYTPLNGSGYSYVMEALNNLGVKNITVVEKQRAEDGNFPTCPSPNPENDHAYDEAFKVCEACGHKFDIIIATDPDSDRLGLVVRGEEDYFHLSGNQVGELMFEYVCRCHHGEICGRNLSGNKVAFKSFVSSPLVEEIGRAYGVEVRNVFTGFKNIVREIEQMKAAGRENDFLFGFEESLGYLYGDYTRDKDGIMAAQMVCLMAAAQKTCGENLLTGLERIYDRYGHTESIASSITFHQEKDRLKMAAMMEELFCGRLKYRGLEKAPVRKEFCYRQQMMYCADLAGGHRVIVRPSGTELKIKIYIFAKGRSRDEAVDMAAELCSWAKSVLEDK